MRRSERKRRATQVLQETNDSRLVKGRLAKAVQIDIEEGAVPKALPPTSNGLGPHVPPAAISHSCEETCNARGVGLGLGLGHGKKSKVNVIPAQQPKVVKVTERKWYFEQGDGVWMRFWADAERAMNVAMDAGDSGATLRTGLDRWHYTIDFKTMTQRNRDHFQHRERKIRFSLP